MKLKKLFAAALLVCSTGAWAQTDVTSTYITNPSFEYSASGTASSAQALSNNGTYYGWTLPNLGASFVNISIGNSSACNGQAFGIPTAKEGTYYYYERRGWNNNSSADATLSTTLSNLPVGHYELTMAYKGLDSWDNGHNSKGSYLKIEAVAGETLGSVQTATFEAVNGNNAGANKFTGDANWKSVSLTFDVATEGNVTLNIIHHFVGGVRTDVAIDNLKLTWTDPLEAAKNRLQDAIGKATTYNSTLNNASLTEAISTATSTKSSATTEVELDEAITTLNAAVVAAVAETNEETTVSTDLYVANNSFETGDFTGWEKYNANDTRIAKNEAGTYFTNDGDGDYLFNTWGGSSAKFIKQTLTNLPEGYYTVTALVASDAGNKITLYAGESTKEVEASSSGKEYFVEGTTPKIYVEANGSLEIGATSTAWYKADNFRLTHYTVAAGAKEALAEAIASANAIDKTTNVGEGTFQKPTSAKNTLVSAIETAEGIYNNPAGDYKTAGSNLAAAVAAWNNVELNAPANGKLFTVSLASGEWSANNVNFSNEAMTYIAGGRNDAGNYAIQYKEAANPNLAQAFTFTHVSGNNYKMSQIDAGGNARYICTGVPYSGNTGQIRTTTDAENALVVTVIPTATEGKWNLWNTEANNYIGAQDAGVYTVNSHIDFAIAETTNPSITINTTAAGWGTVMLPFDYDLPTGVKAYTCEAVDGNTLVMVEQEEYILANTPYIIEGSWEETVTGDAQGTALTYPEGLLTGTYAQIAAPNGSYILQNQNDKVGFYLVNTEKAQPNVPANRAYLTVGGDSSVKAFFLNDTATGINGVMNEIAAGKIYDLGGRKVSKMQKGQTYIVGDKKVTIK